MKRKRFFAKGYVHITNSKQRKHPERPGEPVLSSFVFLDTTGAECAIFVRHKCVIYSRR